MHALRDLLPDGQIVLLIIGRTYAHVFLVGGIGSPDYWLLVRSAQAWL